MVVRTKQRLRAEWAVSSEQKLNLASCCLSLMRGNSLLDELRVKRLVSILL